MSVLTALQSASVRLNEGKPQAFFSSAGAFEVEVCELATETAVAIMKAHDWRKLTTLATATGDGVTTAFDLPEDYDRMVLGTEVHSASWATWRYAQAPTLDFWHDLQTGLTTLDPGFWIILGGQMQFYPALPSGEEARYYYVSKHIATGKAAFTSDEDVFLLDDRLLTLGIIWRWRALKRMDYSEDMANYEVALEEAIARDKGARVLYGGRRPSGFRNVRVAYPGNLGP